VKSRQRLSDKLSVKGLGPLGDNSDPSQEYSLVAKVPLKAGERVFEIDRSFVMSTKTATKDPELLEFIREDSIASAMPNVVLVLHLLNEYSKKEKSFWWPYLSILPSTILPVLRLSKEKLSKLSVSSHIYEALKMRRAIARQYSYFVKTLEKSRLPLSKDLTFDYYCWGVSMVCSRHNEIPHLDKAGDPTLIHALIPVLDMCNHDPSLNQAIFENDKTILVAPSDLDEGHEIRINYGSRSSGDFYIHNGFVPEIVPADVVPLHLSLNKETSMYELKAKLLRMLNMSTFGRFMLPHNDYVNRHKRDPHLTMFLIVYTMTKQELNFILNSDRPVTIADEIYEHVQYSSSVSHLDESAQKSSRDKPKIDGIDIPAEDAGGMNVSALKIRLSNRVGDHLSKRATVCIALIDRIFADEPLDSEMTRLLEHERSIFETYVK